MMMMMTIIIIINIIIIMCVLCTEVLTLVFDMLTSEIDVRLKVCLVLSVICTFVSLTVIFCKVK